MRESPMHDFRATAAPGELWDSDLTRLPPPRPLSELWQRLANEWGEPVLTFDSIHSAVWGDVKPCATYCVRESQATEWERNPSNQIGRYEPKGES
jgi:hypothetical protein